MNQRGITGISVLIFFTMIIGTALYIMIIQPVTLAMIESSPTFSTTGEAHVIFTALPLVFIVIALYFLVKPNSGGGF